MTRTWRDNADEARVLYKTRKDARMATLIATSVTKEGTAGKASASQFAARADISPRTVGRYLTMWDHFSSNHPEYARDRLTPADAMTLVLGDVAQAEFDETPVQTTVQKVSENPGAVADALADPVFSASVAGRLTTSSATTLMVNTVHEHPESVRAVRLARPHIEDDVPRPHHLDLPEVDYVNPTPARLRDINYALDVIEGSIVNLPGRAAYDEALSGLHGARARIDNLIARGEIAREAFGMAAARHAEDNR